MKRLLAHSLGASCYLMLAASWANGQTREEGRQLFERYCAICHAPSQQVDSSGSEVPWTPPDLGKIAERRDGVWPILEVMSIVDGYTKATNPREGMPVIKSLSGGPTVDFDSGNGRLVVVPRRLLAIAVYLESIQSPKPERYVP